MQGNTPQKRRVTIFQRRHTCPRREPPSILQIFANPSADAESKEGGESIHETLETAAECAAQVTWKTVDGTAKSSLPPPSAVDPRARRLLHGPKEKEHTEVQKNTSAKH